MKTALRILCAVFAVLCGAVVLGMVFSRELLFTTYHLLVDFANVLVENAIPEKAWWVDTLFPIATVAVPAACGCACVRAVPANDKHKTLASVIYAAVLTLAAVYALVFAVQYAFIGAAIGGFGFVIGMWMYGKLQTLLPSVFNRETISYIIFGVLTTVVSFVSQMLFASLGTPAWVNTIGSWVCAVTFAYVVNKLFVFESHTDTAKAFFRELWLFFAARLVSLGMELVFMLVTVDICGLSESVCKLIAQVFILIANYVFSKLVIFRKKTE